ncbi:MAG: hypothetical protein P8Q90_05205 [Candidatus Thalassarchaeaceae archaeon]|nr:hypothetical protein [Candidatus Thalassarchaeaceae archaeon]
MSGNSYENFAEWLVLGLVVLATLSIGIEPEVVAEEELEVTHLSGSVTLSTRASMNALGLNDYDRGAMATVDMQVGSVVSEDCANCTGIMIQGQVNVTGLEGGQGGMGRVEAQLNVLHLRESAGEGLIQREWLTIDWDAGSLSTQWDIMIFHEPPMWQPEGRFNAAFSENESRTGPWILIEALLDYSRQVQGCLPDTFTCDSFSQPDINLSSTLQPLNPPVEIPHPTPWSKLENVSRTEESPAKTEQIREMLELGDEESNLQPWCLHHTQSVSSAQAWSVNGAGSNSVAPMSIYLEALALPSTSFTPVSGTWTEIDVSDRGCASLVDEAGVLRLAISVSEN